MYPQSEAMRDRTKARYWVSAEVFCANPLCFNSFLLLPERPDKRYCSSVCALLHYRARDFVELTPEEQERTGEMLALLQSSKLHVEKIEDGNGGYYRAAIESNPEWYSRFCSLYMRRRLRKDKKREDYRRKPKTIIDRKATLRGLERLLEGNVSSLYAERLLDFIRRDLDNGIRVF